uniref:Uncharacterized protein n=1 Tax=Hyaloperonospora arabidopsidis (strain Emoy2) TaxID=559515 RepID=M4B3Y4_HYAAE
MSTPVQLPPATRAVRRLRSAGLPSVETLRHHRKRTASQLRGDCDAGIPDVQFRF